MAHRGIATRRSFVFSVSLLGRLFSPRQANTRRDRLSVATLAGLGHAPVERLEGRVFLSGTTAPVVDVTWHGQALKAYQGQYVAAVKPGVSFENVAARRGFTDVVSLGGSYYQFSSTASVKSISNWAANSPSVSAVSPNSLVVAQSTAPNDTYFASNQYNLNNSGQIVANPIDPLFTTVLTPGTIGADIDAERAWDITTGSADVAVAVLDTGIDLTHPDLVNNIYKNTAEVNGLPGVDDDHDGYIDDVNGWNTVDGTVDPTVGTATNPYDPTDPSDDEGHGTHVSGIIAAEGNNGIGVSGVSWHSKIVPVKVLGSDGSGSFAAIVAGMQYTVALKNSGANIVAMNMSLGSTTSSQFFFNQVLSNALELAEKAGILVVVAAGNDNLSVDRNFTLPAKFNLQHPNVITVAATNNTDDPAFFSNFGGRAVDIAAPGVRILSTAPTYLVTQPPEAIDPSAEDTEPYGFESGTSQATPAVAGIIALEASARPGATFLQLKKALLDGADPLASLSSVNSLPPFVATSGRANAFNAVQNILNQFVSTDTLRRGNWQGFYGDQGSYVVGESTTFPAFVNATFNGTNPVVLTDSTKNISALQRPSDPAQRLVGYLATGTTESLELSFTDGQAHRVGMYFVDFDKKNRRERVELINATTGTVLDTTEISKFSKGVYRTWDVRGDVILRITRLAGPDAVFSGVFFDAPPSQPRAFLSSDSTTQGNWRNNYGGQASLLIGDRFSESLDAGTGTVTFSGNDTAIIKSTTRDKRALILNREVSTGIAAYWSSTSSFTIDVNLTDGLPHQVSVYAVDFDKKKRAERFELQDTAGTVLDRQDLTDFKNGQYLTWQVTGHQQIVVSRLSGPDAVVSGVFVDGAAGTKAQFVTTNTTSRGAWKGLSFAPTNQWVIGETFPLVDTTVADDITALGGGPHIVSLASRDATGLQKVAATIATQRIKAYYEAATTITLNYDPGDDNYHQFAIYVADYEKAGRAEQIDITDPTTNKVVSSKQVYSFTKGKYLIWNIRGAADITITNLAGPNAVFSGVFTD